MFGKDRLSIGKPTDEASAKSTNSDNKSAGQSVSHVEANGSGGNSLSSFYAPPKKIPQAKPGDYLIHQPSLPDRILDVLGIRPAPNLNLFVNVSEDLFKDFKKGLERISQSPLARRLLDKFPTVPSSAEENYCQKHEIGSYINRYHPILLRQWIPGRSDEVFLYLYHGVEFCVNTPSHHLYRITSFGGGIHWNSSSALNKHHLEMLVHNQITDSGEFMHLKGRVEITPQGIKKELDKLLGNIWKEFVARCRENGIEVTTFNYSGLRRTI